MKKRMFFVFSGGLAYFLLFIFKIIKKIGLDFILKIFCRIFIKCLGEKIINERTEFDALKGRKINKFILALPSFGCEHYFSQGGCAMCGFNREIVKYGFRNLHPLAITALVKIFLNYFYYETEKKKIDTMCVFMAGSFLNDIEFPLQAQKLVLHYFIQSKAQKLIIESRPEYIDLYKEKLYFWSKKVGKKEIKINLGLESVNEIIRNKYIKKNLKISDYKKAIQIIKKNNFLVGTYVLLGCPFLTEREIIKETIETLKFAWDQGSDIVNIEVYCVHPGTMWYVLYKKKCLIIPSLWLIVDFIKKIDLISNKWHLGEFFDWPLPTAYPMSCPKCQNKILEALEDLRLNHNIKVLNELEICSCYQS